MELELEACQRQTTTLLQTQIQSLQILALPIPELQLFMQEEFENNPMLEQIDPVMPSEPCHWENDQEESDPLSLLKANTEDTVWFQIKAQLPGNLSETEMRCARYITGNLDNNGYYPYPHSMAAEALGISESEAERILAMLRELDPPGIFAASLQDCLLLQASRLPKRDALLERIIRFHLSDVAAGRFHAAAKAEGISEQEIRQCVERLRKMEPRPLAYLQEDVSAQYVYPDVILFPYGDGWKAEINDAWLKNYSISDNYLRIMRSTENKELSKYFQGKYKRIQFIMESIERRKKTLLAVSEFLAQRQSDFFCGNGTLCSVTLEEAAEFVGIHASTASRAIQDKYLQWPGGAILMKDLFVSRTSGVYGGSSAEIKKMIRSIIDGEDKSSPLSDEAIARIIAEKGTDVARRTVAKYREAMLIGNRSSRRRDKDYT